MNKAVLSAVVLMSMLVGVFASSFASSTSTNMVTASALGYDTIYPQQIIQLTTDEANELGLYVRYGTMLIYVGGPIEGFMQSGYVPIYLRGDASVFPEISIQEYNRLRQ